MRAHVFIPVDKESAALVFFSNQIVTQLTNENAARFAASALRPDQDFQFFVNVLQDVPTEITYSARTIGLSRYRAAKSKDHGSCKRLLHNANPN
jgi:hypothetical protein